MIRMGTALAVLASLASGVAEAHTFGADGAGLVQGFAHPLGGLDHLLAMIAVGLWATQLGGRALWAVPVAFVSMMAVGAVIGWTGMPVAGVEPVIAVSLLLLGLVVTTATRLPVALGMALVGVFALFHGHAHASDLPAAASALADGGGFIAATVLLHGVGLMLGLAARTRFTWALRLGGAGVAAAGAVLMAFSMIGG
jgi:urease accessory protein